MQQEWLIEHQRTEARYWWFVSRRALVRMFLDRHAPQGGRLLEVGCGGGLLSAELTGDGWEVVSTDLFPEGARFARQAGVTRALAFDADGGWPFAPASVEACVMLDVIEHLSDDEGALCEAWRVLKPGGVFVVLTPAYPFLFSAWDTYNGHYRRYTARDFARRARAAQFEVLRATYWNAVSLPPALVLRLRDRHRTLEGKQVEFPKVPEAVNAALIAWGRLEQVWLRHLPLPCGLSVLAVLRKEAQEHG